MRVMFDLKFKKSRNEVNHLQKSHSARINLRLLVLYIACKVQEDLILHLFHETLQINLLCTLYSYEVVCLRFFRVPDSV